MKTTVIVEAEVVSPDGEGVRYTIEVDLYFNLNSYTRAKPDIDEWSIAGIWEDGHQVTDWPDWAHDDIVRAIDLEIYGDYEDE